MEVTEAGMVMLSRLVQPQKVPSLMALTPLGITAVVRLSHS